MTDKPAKKIIKKKAKKKPAKKKKSVAKQTNEGKKLGRPSSFSEALCQKMIDLFKQGLTDREVAEIVGVSTVTLGNWKNQYPDFLMALREAKITADQLVEASLFSRAIGYRHSEEKVFCHEGMITTHETEKHYPPDTNAAKFWLMNRQPKKWREKQTVELEGNPEKPVQVNVSDITDRIALLEDDD